MVRDHRLTRREMLRWFGVAGAAMVVAACAKPTATPTPKPEPTKAAATVAPTKVPPTAAPTATAVPKSAAGYVINTKQKGELTWWHWWGSPVRRGAARRVMALFNAQFPDIKITDTVFPFGDVFNKLIAAVAAGSGMPDVMTDDRPQMKTRAKNKVDIALGDLVAKDGIKSDAFWAPNWEEACANGIPYGIPYESDIRVLWTNQFLLQKAGLDPNKPAATWDDLFTMADKLDAKGADGKLACVTFMPTFGNTGFSDLTWCNGGEWQDKDYNPTINSKEAVETLTWMKKWYDRYTKTAWDAFQGTFGQGAQDGFMSSRVAMKVDIAGYLSFMNFYDPRTEDKNRMLYSVSAVPFATGKKPACLAGGFALAIPTGVKQIDAAWEFIKFAAFEGQASWVRDTFAIPTVKDIALKDPVLNADPKWKFFIEAMAYGRPGVYNPYYPSMLEVLGPAQDAVWAGKMTPKEALDDAQKKAEAEIAKNKK